MGRRSGLDVHRDFAQVASGTRAALPTSARVPTRPEGLREFTKTLRKTDKVATLASSGRSASLGEFPSPCR